MICYHGSDTIVDMPKILKAKRPLDFGGGFYVTTNKVQAEKWAIKVAYRNNKNDKYINCYEFDESFAISNLKVLRFDKADEQWLDFICANRSGKEVPQYDIIIGPVADDSVYKVVVKYENGDIDKQMALKQLKTEMLCDQVLFHTEDSLKTLKYVKTEVLL